MSQDAVTAAIKAADRDEARRDFEKTWDPSAQTPAECGGDAMGGGLMLSRETMEETQEAIMEKVGERSRRHERPVDYLVEMGSFPEPAEVPASIGALSWGRTLTLEELSAAEKMIESMTNPLPPGRLSEGDARTAAGRIYEVQRKDFEARQALYQSVLAKRVAVRAPTLEGLAEWASDKWRQMGGEGPVPGLADGRMSQEALFWLLANLRLSSANWHEQVLPKLPEAGILRDMASMMAVNLELTRRQNEHLGNISMLLAFGGLSSLDAGAGEALRQQYRRAVGSAGQ
jgi:hypothetical protein